MAGNPSNDRVLVMAPIGADARNISSVLAGAGLCPKICQTVSELAAELGHEVGAMVLTDEAVTAQAERTLANLFEQQPPWSDIPVVLISGAATYGPVPGAEAKLRGRGRTVTLLERPLRAATLVSTLNTALAARHRQYEVRDLLHERDALLTSLEARVAERTAELQRMVEEMEAFSYSVSHDLRAPLRSLSGYADALQEDYGSLLPPGARTYCDKIAKAARRMDRLTQDVLAYTRVTRCEMEITSVDLDPLVDEIIEQYPALLAAANGIQAHRPLGCVLGHAPSLSQCFSNLLGNAVKFVPLTRDPHIEVRSELIGTRRRIYVKDNGVGIAPEDHTRIFGMFERAADTSVPGTGIGLAIVKKAIERMAGSLGVNSSPGGGSEFWLELPAAADAVPPQVKEQTSPSWGRAAREENAPAKTI